MEDWQVAKRFCHERVPFIIGTNKATTSIQKYPKMLNHHSLTSQAPRRRATYPSRHMVDIPLSRQLCLLKKGDRNSSKFPPLFSPS